MFGPQRRVSIAKSIEESWGGDIITSAIAQLTHSTPSPLKRA
jgi:hypothetical protein